MCEKSEGGHDPRRLLAGASQELQRKLEHVGKVVMVWERREEGLHEGLHEAVEYGHVAVRLRTLVLLR